MKLLILPEQDGGGGLKLRESGELHQRRRFPSKLNGAVYKSNVKPAILYGSEAWCLKESEMEFLTKDRKIHGENNVWITTQR